MRKPSLPAHHWLRALKDQAQYSPWLRQLPAHALRWKQALGLNRSASLAEMVRSYAVAADQVVETNLASQIAKATPSEPCAGASWKSLSRLRGRYQKALARGSRINRSVLLKAPSDNGERGVILSTFEYNWIRMLSGVPDWSQLEKDYDVIFSNSWSPPDYGLMVDLLLHLKGPVFVQTNNRSDIDSLSRFNPRIRAVPTMPSDWVNPDYYQPKPLDQRAYDIVMVANWAPFKRHWEFFAALRDLPDTWRILLIGQPEGGQTLVDVQRLARDYGVRQEIVWKERLIIDEVSALQAEGRISVVLSRREGACVAVAESLLADSPVGLRQDAHIGARAYITEETGSLLRPGKIAQDLMTLWEKAPSLSPRKWAIANASSLAGHASLQSFLHSASADRGLPWTKGLAPHCWRPYPVLLNKADQDSLRTACRDLQDRYPGLFTDSLVNLAGDPANYLPYSSVPSDPSE